jgi:hypothetical protein
VLVRDGIAEVAQIRALAQGAPPELQAAASLMTANQVGGDVHEPGADPRITSKPISRLVSSHETFLGQVLRRFPIPDRSQNEAENSRPMEADDRIEVVFADGYGILHNGHCLGGQTFLHPPV